MTVVSEGRRTAQTARIECSCKGVRKCAICEGTHIPPGRCSSEEPGATFHICWRCGLQSESALVLDPRIPPLRRCRDNCTVKSSLEVRVDLSSRTHASSYDANSNVLQGVYLFKDVLSSAEEKCIGSAIDDFPWCTSQSGRLKQDYGPQPNFRKQTVKAGRFTGFPPFAFFLLRRMKQVAPELLGDFDSVEACCLWYTAARGACIDPHIDDTWLWGERLVTVSLRGATLLRFSPAISRSIGGGVVKSCGVDVAVPVPPRSLLIVRGSARYVFAHGIRSEDIFRERVAVTFRDFPLELLSEGTPARLPSDQGSSTNSASRSQQNEVKAIMALSKCFRGVPTGIAPVVPSNRRATELSRGARVSSLSITLQ